ncbi:hypothetical protein HY449_03120 [Candidatus Pacearchaeota archaeon]|nr:hypothetical protein [Candidatus Pacearchaeota archaeon]
MRYKVNGDLLEKGIIEALKSKVNQLESVIEKGGNRNVSPQVAVDEYLQTMEVAKSFLIDTTMYDDYLFNNSKELKRRYGIEIK